MYRKTTQDERVKSIIYLYFLVKKKRTKKYIGKIIILWSMMWRWGSTTGT